MAHVKFENFTDEVTAGLENNIIAWLEETTAELASQTAMRTKRGGQYTAQIADKWTNLVDRENYKGYVGNPLEHAIWEELGTGEYALNDDGRKGGWVYYDPLKDEFYRTYGRPPRRCLHHAMTQNEPAIMNRLTEIFRGW